LESPGSGKWLGYDWRCRSFSRSNLLFGAFPTPCSAELAANSVSEALSENNLSAESLGAFASPLHQGINVIKRLIFAFYDPGFSFGAFVKKYPHHRSALIDCLVRDVIDKDMDSFLAALDEMSPMAAA